MHRLNGYSPVIVTRRGTITRIGRGGIPLALQPGQDHSGQCVDRLSVLLPGHRYGLGFRERELCGASLRGRCAAIWLVAGDKSGNWRWYDTAIPLADDRYETHLAELETRNYQ